MGKRVVCGRTCRARAHAEGLSPHQPRRLRPAEGKPADAGQNVGSSSYSCVRERPGRAYIALPSESGLLSHENSMLVERCCLLDKAGAGGNATSGRATTSSTGTHLGISAYDQPVVREERKSAGKRGEGGRAAMLSGLLERGEKQGSEKEGSQPRTFREKVGTSGTTVVGKKRQTTVISIC